MCRSNERTHKHHIIPKYMGGLDTPENLVEVTVTQHAMFHFCNYQLWGNGEDRIAWRAISGQIDVDEIKREVQLLGAKKGGQIQRENGTGIFALTFEQRSENSKKIAQSNKEKGIAIFGMTPEQKSEASRKGAQTNKENGTGIFGMTPEQKSEVSKKAGKIAGQKHKENGTGVCGLTFEQRSANGKKGGKVGGKKGGKKGGQKSKENGTGIFGMTPEQKSEAGKKGGSRSAKKQHAQRWKCTITGYVSTPCGLSNYQKKRGIDTSNRIRII